tara:strand:+ start:86 stop:325 length:240 start_codon:yes stop_codon:yes gene_type:complete
MKLDTPKAIIIGSIIIAAGFFFSDAYERQLSYNKCVRMILENPGGQSKFKKKWWVEKACEWNVYVMKGNWDIFLNFKEK